MYFLGESHLKWYLFFCWFLANPISHINLFAQKKLNTSSPDSTLLAQYKTVATKYLDAHQTDSMYAVLQKGLALANKRQNEYYRGIFLSQMVQYFKKEYQSDSGLIYAQKAIPIMIRYKDWNLVSKLMYRRCTFYLDKKDYLNAIKELDALLRFNNTHNEHSNTGYVYNLLALTFEILNDPVNQKKYILKELEIAEKHNSDQERLFAYYAWASWLESQRQFKTASVYYSKTLKIVKHSQDEEALTETLLSIGNNYINLKEYKKSLDVLLSAEKIALKNQHKTGWNAILSTNYAHLSALFLAKEKPHKALEYAQHSLALLKNDSLRYTYLIRSYTRLINAFKKLGNYRDALNNYERLQELKQTIDVKNSREEAKNIEVKYQLEKIAAEKEAVKDDLQIKELRLQNAQNQAVILWILLGVLTLLLGLGYWFYRKNKIFEYTINKRNLQLEALNETKDKLFGIIGHDLRAPVVDLVNTLTVLEKPALTTETVPQIAVLRKKTINLQTILNNLLYWAYSQRNLLRANPRIFSLSNSLKEALDSVQGLIQEKSLKIIWVTHTNETIYADENHVQIVLYNILHNAIKFSPQGAIIEIALTEEPPNVMLYLTNSGAIFEWKGNMKNVEPIQSKAGTNGEKGTGLGLLVCAELMHLNKGKIHAKGNPTGGTTLVLSFPDFHIVK